MPPAPHPHRPSPPPGDHAINRTTARGREPRVCTDFGLASDGPSPAQARIGAIGGRTAVHNSQGRPSSLAAPSPPGSDSQPQPPEEKNSQQLCGRSMLQQTRPQFLACGSPRRGRQFASFHVPLHADPRKRGSEETMLSLRPMPCNAASRLSPRSRGNTGPPARTGFAQNDAAGRVSPRNRSKGLAQTRGAGMDNACWTSHPGGVGHGLVKPGRTRKHSPRRAPTTTHSKRRPTPVHYTSKAGSRSGGYPLQASGLSGLAHRWKILRGLESCTAGRVNQTKLI